MLKVQGWPTSCEVPQWEAEARGFRSDAAAQFAALMRQRLDMAKLYRRAVRIIPDTIDAIAPQPLPATCPVSLDELLGEP